PHFRATTLCRCLTNCTSRTTTLHRLTGKQQTIVALSLCKCTCGYPHGAIRFCSLTKRLCPVRCSVCQGRLRVCSLPIGLSTVSLQCMHATSLFCTVTCR